MADLSHHTSDITNHPDLAEMHERYERVLNGRSAGIVEGVLTMAGLYLAISAWVVHVNGVSVALTVTNLVLGIALSLLGAGMALIPERVGRLAWLCIPVGAFVIVAPWVVTLGNHGTKPMIWSNAVVGGVILACGLASVGMIAGAGGTRSRARA